MDLFSTLKAFLPRLTRAKEARAELQALAPSGGSKLPPDPPPAKVSNKQVSLPSYLKSTRINAKSPLQRADRLLANTDITTYRQSNDSRQMIRDFARASPDLSAAVVGYIRTAVTNGYSIVAKNPDGTINADATQLALQIVTRMNIINDYTIGFDDTLSVRSLSEVWARELIQYGACAGELVLNKARVPDYINPVSTMTLRLYPSTDGRKLVPKQKVGGDEIDLDIPTFFMVKVDEDLLEPYPVSPIESAVQATIFSAQFMNDIRKVVRKSIHPRVVVTIDGDKFMKLVPQDILNDTEKLSAYRDKLIADVTEQISNLEPEQALVVLDMYGIEVVDHGNTNLSNEYEVLEKLANSKVAAGSKTLPTVLGQANASANVASAEVLMFVKMVEGGVWGKLNEMWSKVLTLSVRLFGQDVYVEFAFNPVELRPESELESFYSMRQSRVLEQLSLGLISDEEACLKLTGHLPPPGFKPLSGTGFFNKGAAPAGDGYNGATNQGGALNQSRNTDAPQGTKGKKADVTVIPMR